jgi:hypothetical protein
MKTNRLHLSSTYLLKCYYDILEKIYNNMHENSGNSEEFAIMNDQYLCAMSLLMEAMASQLSYYEQTEK